MLISELVLENIKGFGEKETGVALDFARPDGSLPHWIVIAGRNGAGKSSLLQAVALAVAGPSAARTLRETFSDWIREGAREAQGKVRLRFSKFDHFAGKEPDFNPWAGLTWTREHEGPEPSIEKISGTKTEPWNPVRGPWAANPQGWFLAGYGPFRRLSLAPTEAQRLMMTPGRPASLASLFREEASLSESVQWLQQLYLRRLEGAPAAEKVEQAVLRLLDDGLLPEGMRVDRVTSEGLWVTTPAGAELPLRSLSDGYRTVAALVLDLVKQLYHAYGDLKEIKDSPHIAFGHEGVVLIDEIDVHLHVSWQQRIGFWLKDHFPNIQFIVSTHSPFICQAADDRGLVRLAAPGETEPARIVTGELFNRVVNGTADDAVLTDLFGLDTPFSEKTVALRREAASLERKAVAEPISPAEAARLKELKSKLPRTPSADVASAIQQLTLSLDDAED
ncbi:AAA family ATPase [Acrocarpospora macrocephala]|uniref:ATP-binding protein n=1 Tax=Acrocarpospora macrocephala TaxID=150177 RepID=A0A5M3WXG7_9ACTN|nr:AAA family ATPase [Acrocarpospora macrocephala]GES14167.1 ATP-binding protein [Acrocarpospora macrocephala]